MWAREDAVELLSKFEAFLAKQGYHCALGGSVLYRGNSEKDLDVIVYPHHTRECQSVNDLWPHIITYFSPEECGKCANKEGTRLHIRDGKVVHWLKKQGQRVDFFFLQ